MWSKEIHRASFFIQKDNLKTILSFGLNKMVLYEQILSADGDFARR